MMKYIFTIHSHITFLSALSVVEYEKLEKKQVTFICSSYKPQLKKNSEINIIKSFDELESSYNILKRISNFNYGVGVDKYIKKIISEDEFIAYIDLMSVFNRFLVTNRQCKQFHFIEEGIVNYGDFDSFRIFTIDIDRFSWRISFKKNLKEILLSLYRILRGRSIKILNLPIHPNSYAFFKGVNYYGFSEFTYPNIPKNKKKITPFSLIKKELQIDIEQEVNFNEVNIWIGDTICSLYKVSMEHYKNALDKLFLKTSTKNNNKIFIKYRGTESMEERKILESTLEENNFNVDFLSKDVIVESLFMNYKNLTIYGNGSSLLIYAKIMEHKVHSIFPYIPDIYNIPLATDFKSIEKLLNF